MGSLLLHPLQYGNPVIVDETLEPIRPEHIQPGDVVGIGIQSTNELRGFEVGRLARHRGAFVVFGGIHATLYPGEAQELGAAHAVVQGEHRSRPYVAAPSTARSVLSGELMVCNRVPVASTLRHWFRNLDSADRWDRLQQHQSSPPSPPPSHSAFSIRSARGF